MSTETTDNGAASPYTAFDGSRSCRPGRSPCRASTPTTRPPPTATSLLAIELGNFAPTDALAAKTNADVGHPPHPDS